MHWFRPGVVSNAVLEEEEETHEDNEDEITSTDLSQEQQAYRDGYVITNLIDQKSKTILIKGNSV